MNLALRSDTDDAAIYLLDDEGVVVAEQCWSAGRKLSQDLLPTAESLLQTHGIGWADVRGVVVYTGPGSFTGLRIGVAVANTIAYSRQVPVVGSSGQDWIQDGITQLPQAALGVYITPNYGRDASTTRPKK